MKRTYVIVLAAAVLLIIAALALRGDTGDGINAWLRSLHGQ